VEDEDNNTEQSEEGEKNVYSEKSREALVDNDELSPQEEAFMKGYDEASGSDELKDDTDDEEEDKAKEKEED